MHQTIKELGKKVVALIPSKMWLSYRFKKKMGYPMNWKNPKTYSQKLQWLKLYDHNPLYTTMVDKYEVKKYVADLIGEEYIIPTLGVWDKFDEIDFDSLPEQFVLKCTHDSGGLIIVKDKTKLDREKARKMFKIALSRNPYDVSREWPYKNVKPRIIAETYMEDEKTAELRDYKFFAFKGHPKAMFIASDRASETEETKFDFFDMDYNHLPFTNGHPNAKVMPEKPANFEEMKALASKLSENLPQARIDFYEVNGKTYFGEITFFHWGGTKPFEPAKWDEIFGSWIELPSKK